MGSFDRTVATIIALCSASAVFGWTPSIGISSSHPLQGPSRHDTIQLKSSPNDAWNGEVVSNTADGEITGCSIEPVGAAEPVLEWKITIDGEQADLGRFSESIYKKITADAKRERFQGFRPGTIPPHLEPTYRAFTMDECARETVLEAMQQNNIRPFDDARNELVLENFLIPPPPTKKKKRKKKKKGSPEEPVAEEKVKEPQWRTFESMKGAVDAGWRPGQSFSFVAKNVRGQKVRSDEETQGASPIGGLN